METTRHPPADADLLPSLVVFAQVVESGSFSDAARRLGLTRSAVSKHVRRLEQRWQTTLLRRTTRAVATTEAGRRVHAHAAQLARSAAAARAAVESLAEAPRGLLRVTTSVAFGRSVLVGLLPGFLRRHPEVDIELLLANRVVDLVEESFDVAVRLGTHPPDLSIARKLRPVRYALVAHPRHPDVPGIAAPRDLRGVIGLHFRQDGGVGEWRFRRDGAEERVRQRSRVAVNDSEAMLECALAGVGFAVLPDYVAARPLAEGRLVQLLPDWQVDGPFGDAVWVIRLPERAVLPRVRAFVDYLLETAGTTG